MIYRFAGGPDAREAGGRGGKFPARPGIDPVAEFCTGDGLYCYPLTVKDGFSRCVFDVRALLSPSHQVRQPIFERLFREYGPPMIVRTDNGAPFATAARPPAEDHRTQQEFRSRSIPVTTTSVPCESPRVCVTHVRTEECVGFDEVDNGRRGGIPQSRPRRALQRASVDVEENRGRKRGQNELSMSKKQAVTYVLLRSLISAIS